MARHDDRHQRRASRCRFWARLGALAAVGIALGILYGTLSPQPPGPPMHGHADKVAHFLAFFTLVFVPVLTAPGRWRWMLPFAIAFGGLIELVQPQFGRTAEWADFWANNAGALTGAVLGVLTNRLAMRRLGDRARKVA